MAALLLFAISICGGNRCNPFVALTCKLSRTYAGPHVPRSRTSINVIDFTVYIRPACLLGRVNEDTRIHGADLEKAHVIYNHRCTWLIHTSQVSVHI
jgi:hypothetical protein